MQWYFQRFLDLVFVKLFARFFSIGAVTFIADEFLRLRHRLHEIVRQRGARANPAITPTIKTEGGKTLARSILEKESPWLSMNLPDCPVPGMLTKSEKQYYTYLMPFYSGKGEVVEIGCWLGQSTWFLFNALEKNPNFGDKKLHVFDDFTWRASAMDKWLKGLDLQAPEDRGSFLPLFEEQMKDFADRLEVKQRKISDYRGNEHLETISWSGEPIEIIVIDCGRLLEVNDAWWKVFEPSFIPDTTLIVMQDWQNYKRVPELFWENMKIFTDSKLEKLDLIHEVAYGATATFVYRGEK